MNYLNLLKAIACFTIFACLMQSASAENNCKGYNFIFNFGKGINTVTYSFPQAVNNTQGYCYTNFNGNREKKSKISVYMTQLNNSTELADKFNNEYPYGKWLNLNGNTNDKATRLDFQVEGILSINGHQITTANTNDYFALSHEAQTNNWLLAANNTTTYANPGNYYMMEVLDSENNKYCIKADKNKNYSVTVDLGACNDITPVNTLTFVYDEDIFGKLAYEQIKNPDPGLPNYESDITISNEPGFMNSYFNINVPSVMNNSILLGNDFTSEYSSKNYLILKDKKSSNAAILDFWLSGTLRMGKCVFNNFHIAHDGKNNSWIIASEDGYYYDGVFYLRPPLQMGKCVTNIKLVPINNHTIQLY